MAFAFKFSCNSSLWCLCVLERGVGLKAMAVFHLDKSVCISIEVQQFMVYATFWVCVGWEDNMESYNFLNWKNQNGGCFSTTCHVCVCVCACVCVCGVGGGKGGVGGASSPRTLEIYGTQSSTALATATSTRSARWVGGGRVEGWGGVCVCGCVCGVGGVKR